VIIDRPLTGLTWDHPRGYNALSAAALLRVGDLDLSWDRQPLEGFESHPIADLCDRYDLIVLDHPHLGEAISSNCLYSLEEVFQPSELKALTGGTIGPTAQSYAMHGKHWAVPLDAATQVSAWRQDLIDFCPGNLSWDDVLKLSADTGKVALSLAGPHALLSYFSILASMGEQPGTDEDSLFHDQPGQTAYALMQDLVSRSPGSVSGLNPIEILKHMATTRDVALCPLIYGYVNYSVPSGPGHSPVHFSDAPHFATGGAKGSTLGGTGIALSRRCPVTPQLRSHLIWLMCADAQRRFIPQHQGQPALEEAWEDKVLNQTWSGFYASTATSLRQAFIRPRYNGYIQFQTRGSCVLRSALSENRPWPSVSAELQSLYRESRITP